MNARAIRCSISCSLIAALLAAAAGLRAEDEDHVRATELRDAGAILPLRDILGRAELKASGRLVEAELERHGDSYVYKLEFLDAEGRSSRRYYDARSGEPRKEPQGDEHRGREGEDSERGER